MGELELWPADFFAPPMVDEATFRRMRWAHVTPAVLAGGHAFRVRVTDADLGPHIDQLLAGFLPAPAGAVATTYSIVSGVNGHSGWWVAYADDTRISNGDYASVALTHVFGHVNRAVVERRPAGHLALHAAACAWEGKGVVMAGPTESGKSTLVTGLGQRGFTYLTDEVVVVDPERLTVTPYPKPPSIDPGAWEVLSTLRPRVPVALSTVSHSQWHVEPALLSGGVATSPVPVHLLLRCRWRHGSPTLLRPCSRARMVLDIAMDMFRPRADLARQVQVLARLAEEALVYELIYDDLDEASSAVRHLLENAVAAAR